MGEVMHQSCLLVKRFHYCWDEMLHTWKPLHSLSISHVFRTEGAPCLPAEEQSKLPHGDQRERQGQNMPAHALGGLSFEDSFFPGQDCW